MTTTEDLVPLARAELDKYVEGTYAAYYDDTTHPPGDRIEVDGMTLTSDNPFLVVFVDEQPGANWSHPSRYLVVTCSGVTPVTTQWPPSMKRLPPNWHVLDRSIGVEDWQLLPLAAPT